DDAPLALFHNIFDLLAYNALVLWQETNPGWMSEMRHRRRLYPGQLGRALVAPLVEYRTRVACRRFSAQLVRDVRKRWSLVSRGWPACRAAVAVLEGESAAAEDNDEEEEEEEEEVEREKEEATEDGKRKRYLF
ncbi:hypothetical protein GOODEAATRI_015963, partial [Goodea atripinnis]